MSTSENPTDALKTTGTSVVRRFVSVDANWIKSYWGNHVIYILPCRRQMEYLHKRDVPNQVSSILSRADKWWWRWPWPEQLWMRLLATRSSSGSRQTECTKNPETQGKTVENASQISSTQQGLSNSKAVLTLKVVNKDHLNIPLHPPTLWPIQQDPEHKYLQMHGPVSKIHSWH